MACFEDLIWNTRDGMDAGEWMGSDWLCIALGILFDFTDTGLIDTFPLLNCDCESTLALVP